MTRALLAKIVCSLNSINNESVSNCQLIEYVLDISLTRCFNEMSNDATDNRCIKSSLIAFFQGIKMLVAVVVLYAVLWLPMNLFQLSLNLLCYPTAKYHNFCNDQTLLKLLYIAAHFLTVSNTAINPIIYGFANHRFRVSSIEHVLCCVFTDLSRFI